MKEVALITLHGMGKKKPHYFSDLEDGLKKSLGNDWMRISFQKVQYASILQEPQNKLWRDMVSSSANDLDATKIRQFFLFGFGDAGSLEYSAHNDKVKYLDVQKEIQSALRKAYVDLGQDKSKPIVIIAQSLGCQVISNYLWDADHNKYIFENTGGVDLDELDFLKLKSLRNLVTTGCNIPLFISGISDRKCFKKPNSSFKWDNYYDPDDVLGWPLRQLGPTFKIVSDHNINAGGLFTSWNPLSHEKYWSDKDVVRPLANKLMNLLS
ncbi:MAG TPA: hypothetical protein ENJ13_06110 [Chromatiales bacterium]|nr:hypothetical protein [Chromatiales bacterium]